MLHIRAASSQSSHFLTQVRVIDCTTAQGSSQSPLELSLDPLTLGAWSCRWISTMRRVVMFTWIS